MSKLVHGFSNIMKPMNLVANGNFQINQRGGSLNTWITPAVGQYVSDAWYIHGTAIDFVEINNVVSIGSGIGQLDIKGYGKKGQHISIMSKSLQYNYLVRNTTGDKKQNTGSCFFSNGSGVRVNCSVAGLTSATSLVYNKILSLKANQSGFAVRCDELNANDGFTNTGYFKIVLEEDGEFFVTVRNFQQISGLHKNPSFIHTPNDMDLMRCKRFYQTGHSLIAGLGYSNGTNYIIERDLTFEVEMAGVPTITSILTLLREEGSTTDVSASYSMGTTPTSKSLGMFAYKAIGGDKPVMANIDWIAEI